MEVQQQPLMLVMPENNDLLFLSSGLLLRGHFEMKLTEAALKSPTG